MIYVFRPGTTSLNFFMQSRTLLAWTGSLGTSRCFEATELRSKYSAKISDSVMRAPSPARGSRSERVRNTDFRFKRLVTRKACPSSSFCPFSFSSHHLSPLVDLKECQYFLSSTVPASGAARLADYICIEDARARSERGTVLH